MKNDKLMNSFDMYELADPRPLPQRHGQKEANQELWTPRMQKICSDHASSKSVDKIFDDDRLGTTLASYESFSKMFEKSRTGAVPWNVIVSVFPVSWQGQWLWIDGCSSFGVVCYFRSYAHRLKTGERSRVRKQDH